MSARSSISFRIPLIASGVLFALTACACSVVAIRRSGSPSDLERPALEGWLWQQLDQHGTTWLLVEVAVLAVIALATVVAERNNPRQE
jgi:hypothetical protein